MKYTVEVNQPNRPKGDPIEVPLLGGVVNNGSKVDVELTEEDAELLSTVSGVTVKQGSKKVATSVEDKEGGETSE